MGKPGFDSTVEPEGWECSNCGAINDPGENFCDNCSADTDGVVPDEEEEDDEDRKSSENLDGE